MNLIAYLLHVANTDPPTTTRTGFYDLKHRLLKRRAHFAGHDIQEIRKECWGPWNRRGYDRVGCLGERCPHCGGTGVFDLRWVRLERWEWAGYTFHVPVDNSRVVPSPYPNPRMIHGRIEHRDYGRGATEAALWLYVLCGEWRLLWRTLRGSSHCYPGWWPLCNLQRIVMHAVMWLRWKKCWCGRWFPTWGSGWQACHRCRKPKPVTNETEDIPF